MSWFVSAVTFTQPKVTLEGSLNEELSRLHWHVSLPVGDYLDFELIIPRPLWAAAFPRLATELYKSEEGWQGSQHVV